MLPQLHFADDDDRPAAATGSPLRLVPPPPTLAGRDRRVKVMATTRVTTDMGERVVRLVGLSAHTALLFVPEPVGIVGHCVDLFLPVVGGREIQLTAGIDSVERVLEGYAVTLRFIVADPATRAELHGLLALLFAADESKSRQKQTALLYDVLVCYGPTHAQRAHLEEISPSGLSMRVRERIAHDARVDVLVPALRNGPALPLRGRVRGQRLSKEGGYHTQVGFEGIDGETRAALSALLADLMCR